LLTRGRGWGAEAHREQLEAVLQHGDSALLTLLSGLLGVALVLRRLRTGQPV
jgi:hypothetical protein